MVLTSTPRRCWRALHRRRQQNGRERWRPSKGLGELPDHTPINRDNKNSPLGCSASPAGPVRRITDEDGGNVPLPLRSVSNEP